MKHKINHGVIYYSALFVISVLSVFASIPSQVIYGDSYNYLQFFSIISNSGNLKEALSISRFEPGYASLSYFITIFFEPETAFYVSRALVALLIIVSFSILLKQDDIKSDYISRLFIFISFCLMFTTVEFVTNVQRSGWAAMIGIAALCFAINGRAILCVCFCVAAYLFHESSLIFSVGFLGWFLYKKVKYIAFLWLLLMAVSYFNLTNFIHSISLIILRIAPEHHDSFAQSGISQNSNLALFAAIPIAIRFAISYMGPIRSNTLDTLDKILCVYMMSSAVYLLSINLPFSNRYLYPSLFLMPVFILYFDNVRYRKEVRLSMVSAATFSLASFVVVTFPSVADFWMLRVI